MVRMRFALATAPTAEPVTSAELAAQCRIGSAEATAEATYIAALIKAARTRAENLCGPIMSQVWDGYLDGWPRGDVITIEKPRATAITSIKYTPEDAAVASTLSAADYTTDFVSHYARIRLRDGKSWPSDTLERLNPIVIRFTAGYAPGEGTGHEADNVPPGLKQAILFLAGHWYDTRTMVADGQIAEIPQTFTDLIADYREWGF